MIKIQISQKKKEDPYIEHFAQAYLANFYPQIKEVTIDCPDSNSKGTAADYFLEEPNILVEIKEVHDSSGNRELGILGGSTRLLRDELEQRDLSWVRGYFSIQTPWDLKIRKEAKVAVIDQLLKAVKEQRTNLSIDKIGVFKIEKFSDEGSHVSFNASGGVRSIDPVSTIYENIHNKIDTANKQLGSYHKKVNKKILLLVNRYIFADPKNVVEALSRYSSDLVKQKNIDEIWLIFQDQENNFLVPELLYTKDFLSELAETKLQINTTNIKLLEKWFSSLEKVGEEYKEKLFLVMKYLFVDVKPHELIKDDFTREQMVQIGIWLAQKERFEDVTWIVKKFIDDPDPGRPEDYNGDPNFNYHEKIMNGEDPRIITTVLGHLAWVIQKLCTKEQYISFALEYTEKLLKHPNLYVNLQGIIPLTEIAARRQWLKGWNCRPYIDEYKLFNELCFDLIKLLERHKTYEAIADWTAHLFAYYKDLDTDESIRMLNALKISYEVAGLFVYFCIFRERHYKDLNIPFDSERLSLLLHEFLVGKEEPGKRIIASISWHFRKILHDEKEEFQTLKPYIDLLFKQPYYRGLYGDIEMIIEDWITIETDITIQWFNQYLDRAIEYLRPFENIQSEGSLWLSLEAVMDNIARLRPSALIEILPKVTKVCKKGGYVGNFNQVFQGYKIIDDEQLSAEIKELSKKLYQTIETDYPMVNKLNWQD